MHITVNQAPLYAYTGGKPFNPEQPTVVMIHGVLNDHSVWLAQSRYLAHHGFNVLAIDLPGHGLSAGKPPESVEEAASAIVALLDAQGVDKAALVGHSFGSLIALEVAARAPQRVSRLALVGTAFPMKVSPALLDSALNAPEKAIHMVNVFSHSSLTPPEGSGVWLLGVSRALMRRVLASNTEVNVFHTGFNACDSYAGGEQAMAAVQCPTLFVVGRHDQMTPPKSAKALAKLAKNAKVVEVDAGHAMMSEAPQAVAEALRGFLAG